MGINIVYRLIFTTGQFYIGSTQEIEKRIDRHNREIRNGNHHNVNIQALCNAGHTFTLELDNFGTREEAYVYEEKLIKENMDNPDMLNIGLNARAGDNLTNHPEREAIIAKRTETQIAKINAMSVEERKAKYGLPGELNGMFGRTHTDEVKQASSDRSKGNSFAKGTIRSDVVRKGMSERAKLRTGEKNPFHGKTHSDVTKNKLRLANTGKIPVNARRVEIDSVIYESATSAAKHLGCAVMTILNRINNTHERFSGYRFLD